MKKRLFGILLVVCLLLVSALPAFAADSGAIADYADLLTDEQEQQLLALTEQAVREFDCGVYIVTVWDYSEYGDSPYEAAVALYGQLTAQADAPQDGVLLMLSMRERDYSLITYGAYAEAVFSHEAMWEMEDAFLTYFAQDRWFEGFECYARASVSALADYETAMTDRYGEGYASYYDPGVPDVVVRAYKVQSEIWLAVVFGSLAVALIACLVMKSGMRTARKATHADAYIPAGGVDLRIRQDLFTHTTTHVIHHPKQTSGGGGRISSGGGFRGHSGKF